MANQEDVRQLWFTASCVAAVQLGVAGFAVYSSSQDILSDGACIGGIFGSLANMGLLVLTAVTALILAVRSRHEEKLHRWVSPLLLVTASSGLAILIGMQAGLSCTV